MHSERYIIAGEDAPVRRDAPINQRFHSKGNEERCLLGHQNTALQFDESTLEITNYKRPVRAQILP
jgi:hypothetical protein